MTDYQEHIPPFPPEFGEDKGEFFKHYDRIQDEIDNEMVKRLKENLDGLLVFAGLFAGINSAFLAFTFDLVSPDPLDDISSLLQQIMEGLKSPMGLPSMSFSPPLKAILINALFALSLSSALFASFFAVLGKQWLMLYRNMNGGGVDQQRWEQLRRSLGAERWGLVPVLEVVLPILIQAALIIFAVGFVSLLRTMSKNLAIFVLVPLVVASVLSALTAGFSLWDASCPFRHPLSEIILKTPVVFSAIARLFRRQKQTRVRKELLVRFKTKLGTWRTRRGSRADHNEGATGAEVEKGVESGFRNAKDVETGNIGADVAVQTIQPSATPQTANPHRPGRERWRLIRTVISKRRLAMKKPKTNLWNFMANLWDSKTRLWDSFWGFQLVRVTEDDRVLQVESIKRVINISEDPKALYHAALNLRSITDLKLLERLYDDESTTRGLRECYLEALEELENKHSRDKPNARLLRETLAFGAAFFHVSFSAASFDDFMTMIGIKDVTLPLDSSDMSPAVAKVAGDSCRQTRSFIHDFIWLQMRGLGRQPMALTSTTLAAVALWYAINGIPHSQEVVYGSKFREALVSSEVSWAGLELLAFVTSLPCKFYDVERRKPYGSEELDWCRYEFLRVRDTYSLSEPTKQLADAVHASLSTGKNLETNAILFKFAWRLFTKDDEGDSLVELGERALSAGHLLICALEEAISIQKAVSSQEARESKAVINAQEAGNSQDPEAIDAQKATRDRKANIARKAAEKYESAREMCFKAMIECMGPRYGEIKILKRTAWRQRLTLKTATAYMNYIMNLEKPIKYEATASAKEFMDRIRQALTQNLPVVLALGKEHVEIKREFEETYSRLWPSKSGGTNDGLQQGESADSIINPPADQSVGGLGFNNSTTLYWCY